MGEAQQNDTEQPEPTPTAAPVQPVQPAPQVIYQEVKPFKRRIRRIQDYMIWLVLFALLGLIIAGSAGLIDFPPQSHAGITKVELELTDTGTIKRLKSTDGKERSVIEFQVETGDTKITVTGKDVEAFTGQLTRSDVEKILAEKGIKEPSNKTLDAIMLLLKAL